MGHSRGSNSLVILVGKTRNLNSLVILVHSLSLVAFVPQASGYSEIPKLSNNFSKTLKIGNF